MARLTPKAAHQENPGMKVSLNLPDYTEEERLERELAMAPTPWHLQDDIDKRSLLDELVGDEETISPFSPDFLVNLADDSLPQEHQPLFKLDGEARAEDSIAYQYGFQPGEKLKIISTRRAEEWWIKQSRANPLMFGWYILGLRPAAHHKEWAKQLFEMDAKKNKTIIIAPRGSAKSTWAVIFLLWVISNQPWLAHMIISVTLKQASDRMNMLRDIIEHNVAYKKVFPHVAVDYKRPNNAQTLNLKLTNMTYAQWRSVQQRKGDPKSPTLFASGVGGSGVIGSRISGLLLLDDIMDAKNIRTDELRDELWRWVNQTLLPTLTGDLARVLHVTTRWGSDDLVVRSIKTGEWTYSYTRALERGPDGNPISYWPQLFPLERLDGILKAVGSTIFKLMYLCITTGLAGDLFELDWLRQDMPDKMPKFDSVWISVDAAVTKKTRSDRTAIATIGVVKRGDGLHDYYLLKLKYGKWGHNEVINQVISAWGAAQITYNAKTIVGFEAVAGQKVYLTLLANKKIVPPSNIFEFKPSTDKVTRSRPFAAAAEFGRFYMSQTAPYSSMVQSQCVEFTGDDGAADDLVDVIGQVIDLHDGNIMTAVSSNANFELVVIPGLN